MVKVPTAPPNLSAEAKRFWKHNARELTVMRVLTAADRDALVDYCEALSEIADIRTLRRAVGYRRIVFGEGGDKTNPLDVQYRQWTAIARALRADLGLSPVARERASQVAGDDETKQQDEFTAYQQRRQIRRVK